MEVNLSETSRQLIQGFILLLLPLIILVLGVLLNIQIAWYFILSILWFGSGIVFYGALN